MKYDVKKHAIVGVWQAVKTPTGKLTKEEALRVCEVKNGIGTTPAKLAFDLKRGLHSR
jgi:hypothetical protein